MASGTGYTFGIIDGTTTTFEQFAKLCVKAFGACVHMRDDGLSEPYKERIPSNYHIEQIEKATILINDSAALTNHQILERRKAELKQDKEYHEDAIKKDREARIRLRDMLAQAHNYKPPTEEHEPIKKFMIEQLELTIKGNDSDYHKRKLEETNTELNTLDVAKIREQMLKQGEKDLAYHTKEHSEEIKRCKDSNQFIKTFFDSLTPTTTI